MTIKRKTLEDWEKWVNQVLDAPDGISCPHCGKSIKTGDVIFFLEAFRELIKKTRKLETQTWVEPAQS